MVPTATLLACIATLLVSLVLPVAVLAIFAIRNKKQGILTAWLLGAAGFFVTQILIRLPILMVLQTLPGFAEFSGNHLFFYAFSLAFTAGLFELAGRFTVAKLMRRNLTWNRSLAAGLGHGGIEAMLLIGMTYVNNLVYIVMINTGAFDTVLAQAGGMGIDVSALELIREQLVTANPGLFLLAGLERILAMTAHCAMSALVCWGVARKKAGIPVLLCLGIHTLMDLTAGLSMVLPQNIAYPIIYSVLILAAAISLVILRNIRRNWKEAHYDPQE